jgi:hypothetical protein
MCAAAGGTGSHFASSSKSSPRGGGAQHASSAGFAAHAPNGSGSQAEVPSPTPHTASPSETDAFLAVSAAASCAGAYEQPTLALNSDAVQTAAAQPNRPVNPLVAARTANAAQGSTDAGLFPIQDVERGEGRSFDTSFAEGGRRRGVVVAVVVIVLLALVAAGAFFGLRWKAATDARANIDAAVAALRLTDDVMVPLDTAIATAVSGGDAADDVRTVMLQSTSAATNLTEAETLANAAYDARDLLDADDITATSAVLKSVTARRTLLDEGRTLQAAATSYSEALDDLNAAYTSIYESWSNTDVSQSTWTGYYDTLNAGGDASGYDRWGTTDYDNAAVAAVQTAQGWVEAAKAAYPDASYDALDAYLDALLYQLSSFASVNVARLNEDYEAYDVAAAAFNESWATVEATWAACPQSADDLLAGSFAATAAAQRDAYEAARQQCVDADAVINDYLGIVDESKALGLASTSPLALAAAQIQVVEEPAAEEPAAEGEGEPAADADQVVEGDQAADVPAEDAVPAEG